MKYKLVEKKFFSQFEKLKFSEISDYRRNMREGKLIVKAKQLTRLLIHATR